MKFEEALPLLREGIKFKCEDWPGFYTICNQALFGMDLGEGICNILPDGQRDIFHWGVNCNALLSDKWEIYEGEEQPETEKMEGALDEAIHQTIFNFFMNNTGLFSLENNFVMPLAKPLTEDLMNMLRKFLTIDFDKKD